MEQEKSTDLSPAIRRYAEGKITAAEYLKEIRESTGVEVRRQRKSAAVSQRQGHRSAAA